MLTAKSRTGPCFYTNFRTRPDDVAGTQLGLPFGLLRGSDQGDRGVRGEQLPDDFGLCVERVQLRGVQIQRAQGSTASEKPISEHRPDTVSLGGRGKAGPPSVL